MREPCVLLEIECMAWLGKVKSLTVFKICVRRLDAEYFISKGARYVDTQEVWKEAIRW